MIVWLNFETLLLNYFLVTTDQNPYSIAFLCKDLISNLISVSDSKFLFFIKDYFAQSAIMMGNRYDMLFNRISLELYEQLYDSTIYINLKHIIAKVSIKYDFDFEGKYHWNVPYSKVSI